MQCAVLEESQMTENDFWSPKKDAENSHCRVREYFLKGIKISDGIYIFAIKNIILIWK